MTMDYILKRDFYEIVTRVSPTIIYSLEFCFHD